MTRDTDYKVVKGANLAALQTAVNTELAKVDDATPEQWEPIGEVYLDAFDDAYSQGLIKVRSKPSVVAVRYSNDDAAVINAQRVDGFGIHNIITIPNNTATAVIRVATMYKYRSTPKGC